MCGQPAQVSDWTTPAHHLQAAFVASASEMLVSLRCCRVFPPQGDSGRATRLGVIPGVTPWRRGCEQPAFSDCANGEELADEGWLAVRRSSSVWR